MSATVQLPMQREERKLNGASIPPEFWDEMEGYRAQLVSQARTILGNCNDAEEVVQETFCEVFKERAQLPGIESVGAWISTINKRLALNRLRARKRYSEKMLQKQRRMPARSETTGGFSGIDLHEIVDKGLESLPPRLRAVIVLRYFRNQSYEEIAERLGVPLGTVSHMLCQASMLLYKRLNLDRQDSVPFAPESEEPPR